MDLWERALDHATIEYEAYDYATKSGQLEIDNVYDKRGASAGDKALVKRLDRLLDRAMQDELEQPVPAALKPAQTQALADWFSQPPGEFTKKTDN